jgi:VIT1/CCC1 family predicted Fe2+/Mn2+ transporter
MHIKQSLKTGFSFGLTSGIITTLGLMVGLEAGTESKMVVVGGILTIAVADAFSDALGIHLSQESENRYSFRSIWESTFATFMAKFFVALTFVIPVLFFSLTTAVIISIVWGLSLLGIFSYYLARLEKIKPWHVIGEHLSIAVLVIIITHFVGNYIKLIFQ